MATTQPRAEAPAWERWLPGIAVLRRYERRWLRGDVLGGITVTAYLVPQVLAYAEVAGLPAIVGLWAVVPGLLAYAVLGSSRQLSVGPESTTALMTAAGVGALVAVVGPDRYAEVAALLAIAVGVISLIGWIARLGFLAQLFSGPVLVGYMAGIAALMIVSQIHKVTGIEVESGSLLTEVWSAVRNAGTLQVPTLILALAVLVVLFAFHWRAPKWPGPLIAMLGAAVVVWFFDLTDLGISVVGEVPQGLPQPRLPDLLAVDLWALLPVAAGVSIVAYTDNVLTGRAFAIRRREEIDAQQEFLALGSANLAAGMFQGFPISSSGSRTVIADAMGARTQLHSLVSIVLVIATLLWLGPLIGTFPTAALGAVVVYAAIRIIDIAELRRIARFRKSELVLALATTLSVLLFGVLIGIGVAVGLSVLDLIRRIAHPHDGILGYVPDVAGMHDIDDYPEAVQVPGLVVYRYDSPLFFANANDFTTRALDAVEEAEERGPVHWLLLNTEANVEVDLTAVDALDELRAQLEARGVRLALARVKDDLRVRLVPTGFLDRVGEEFVFPTLPTAVGAYARWYEEQHGRPLPRFRTPSPPCAHRPPRTTRPDGPPSAAPLQIDDVAPEREHQEDHRDAGDQLGEPQRHERGQRDDEREALETGDEAPRLQEWQRRRPYGPHQATEPEQIAREPDHERPGRERGHGQGGHEQDRRVGLHVPARTTGRRRIGRPRDGTVHRIEGNRRDQQQEQRPRPLGQHPNIAQRDQGPAADDTDERPRQGHPVGRSEPGPRALTPCRSLPVACVHPSNHAWSRAAIMSPWRHGLTGSPVPEGANSARSRSRTRGPARPLCAHCGLASAVAPRR
ncbi:MAG: sulfate permease [Propionibacteriaceae bacterium]|nr:sulfate permease [Propionibacteriaceae bacterium]